MQTTAADTRRNRTGTRGHDLVVRSVDRLTDDAIMVGFSLPPALVPLYQFRAGQHVVIYHDHGGEELRRSYSICVAPRVGQLAIAIKRVDGGRFSNWAVDHLQTGDTLHVGTPIGRFGPMLKPGQMRNYAAIAAGSGITPVISIITAMLKAEPRSSATLIYGNRTLDSAMFLDELTALARRYPERFELHLVCSRQAGDAIRHHGRIGAELIRKALLGQGREIDGWFICGPPEMTEGLADALAREGVEEERIQREFFTASGLAEVDGPALPELTSDVTVRLDGVEHRFELEATGPTILEAGAEHELEMPYACADGVCTSCRAKVIEGEVQMDRAPGLDHRERAEGYVLTCQAHPISERVVIDFDA